MPRYERRPPHHVRLRNLLLGVLANRARRGSVHGLVGHQATCLRPFHLLRLFPASPLCQHVRASFASSRGCIFNPSCPHHYRRCFRAPGEAVIRVLTGRAYRVGHYPTLDPFAGLV